MNAVCFVFLDYPEHRSDCYSIVHCVHVHTGAVLGSVAWGKMRRQQFCGTNQIGGCPGEEGLKCGCNAAAASATVINVVPSSNT